MRHSGVSWHRIVAIDNKYVLYILIKKDSDLPLISDRCFRK